MKHLPSKIFRAFGGGNKMIPAFKYRRQIGIAIQQGGISRRLPFVN